MTPWLPYIAASAATLSFYDLCKKHSAAHNRTFTVLCFTTLAGFVAVAIALCLSGRLGAAVSIPPAHRVLLVLKALLVSTSWSLAYWALKTLPITVMAPIRATGPVWTLAGALVLFGEIPCLREWAGFALAFCGCMAFSLATKREGLSLSSPSILLAAGATLTGSASALYDKCLLNSLRIPPDAVLFWFMGAMSLVYAVAAAAFAGIDKTRFEWRWTIPAVGVLLAASDFCYFAAIAQDGARISVLSTIRRASTITTFLIGGAVFRETNLLRKGLALLAILAGVLLLCLD